MRICFLADGQSIHTRRWCKHFASAGHEVHLITFRKGEIENTKVHFIDAGDISSAGGNWKVLLKNKELKNTIKHIAPDILHAQYATSYGIAGARTGFHPYIITTLGSDILVSPKQSFLYRTLVKHALKKADWVTAMADHMKEAILELGIDSRKVDTVMFGIDPTVFNHSQRRLPENKFIITCTRNLEPVYNIPLLIKAVSIVKDKIPGLQVNLIGDGSLREELKKMIMDLKADDLFSFMGKVPQTEIASTLNQTHLFATTSLSDGNNVSLNEAMACGTVSVATDIPANRQWIQNGINGFLVPIDNPEVLAEKILYVYQHYNDLEKKAIPFNDQLIQEKALWSSNMAIVEKKYADLVRNK